MTDIRGRAAVSMAPGRRYIAAKLIGDTISGLAD